MVCVCDPGFSIITGEFRYLTIAFRLPEELLTYTVEIIAEHGTLITRLQNQGGQYLVHPKDSVVQQC